MICRLHVDRVIDACPAYSNNENKGLPGEQMGITFVEDRFHSKSLVVRKSTRQVVSFGVADHETKVCLKPKALLVHPGLQLRSHSADVHRVFDDLKIAVMTISLRVWNE